MLSHIATDLHQVYLEEVFTPQFGKPGASTPVKPKSSPAKPKSSSDIDGDGDVDSFEKKVRQVVYDVHHIMKRDNIPAEQAFEKRSSKTNYSVEVINTAKEKLGIKGGSSTSVSEEILSEDDTVGIVVNYKNGTTYRKSVSRVSVQTELQKFRSNPNVSSVERTGYGLSKRDYDGDGKVEDPSKEHAGSVHNAIQRATGGTPDGKDTRGKTSKKKLKSYGVSEGFSNWREDLFEVADEVNSKKKSEIKEDPSINNKVTINPEFQEQINILGGAIIEEFELDEEYISESVNIATEFFYNCGLNENGIHIVIEELGEETFAEFVFELSEEYFLTEELKKSEDLKGTKMSTKDRIASIIQKDRVKTAVDEAKETQSPSFGNNKKGNVRNVIESTLNTVACGEVESEVPKKKVNEAIASVRKDRKPTRTEKTQRKIAKLRIGIGEDLTPTTSKETQALMKLTRVQQELNTARRQSLQKNKNKTQEPQEPQTQNASYEPEGEMVDEARAEEKRGLGSTGAERQRQKKGVVTSSGQVAHPATSYSGGQNPHTRGKDYLNKTQRRASSRRYVDQPGGAYAAPENQQGKYSKMQAKKRDQSYMSTKGT